MIVQERRIGAEGYGTQGQEEEEQEQKGAVIVISTFSSEESAAKVARTLVEKGLCACVNFTKVRSIYSWQGKLEDQPEYLALFKAAAACAKPLKEELANIHPYEVPEIVELKMSDISKPYLSWLNGSAHRISKNSNHSAQG
jgi:periplasmic divalent cation tolerance protein